MSLWVGTFGVNGPRGVRFVEFEARNEAEARETMVRNYGCAWAFVYPSREAAGVDEFQLIPLPLGR